MRTVAKIDTDKTITLLDLDAAEGSLKVLQDAVGGYIECISLTDKLEMYGHDEAKLIGLDINPVATAFFTKVYGPRDIIMGPVVFTGGVDDEGEDRGLTEDQVKSLRYAAS